MDWQLIDQKLESLRRPLRRVVQKCPDDMETLSKNVDAQDIITLNLTRAEQCCVDIGTHLITDTDVPTPDTMGKVFDGLSSAGIINPNLVLRIGIGDGQID